MKVDKQQKKAGPEFNQGYNACDEGIERHRNPYIIDSEQYEWWRRGWERRYYNEPAED